jgi:hypothetical protein
MYFAGMLAGMFPRALEGVELELVARVPARYIDWRESAAEVDRAYRRWSIAAIDERPGRSAAFRAALDEEASAANRYASAIEELEDFRRWPHGLSDPRLPRDSTYGSEHT